MCFSTVHQERVKAANPTLKVTELSKKFSEEWAALSADQKQVYADKAAAEKKIADEKIAAYLAENPDAAKGGDDEDDEGEGKKKSSASKKKKDPNMPKKGRTSYLIFQEEIRVRDFSFDRIVLNGECLFSGASQGSQSDVENDGAFQKV
jgi:hypothetical protein